MPLYFGKAGDASGLVRPFTIDAGSRAELNRRLSALGLHPLEVEEAARGFLSWAFWSTLVSGRVQTRSLIGFARSLSVLIESGIPLLDGLGAVIERERNPYAREVLVSVARAVEGGKAFHEALSAHPDVFPTHFVHSIQAGERSASLDTVLERLATDLESQDDLRGQLGHAMVYPALLGLGTIALFIVSVVFVIPRFQEFYSQQGLPLPAFTSTLLTVVEFAWQHLLLIILLVALVVVRLVMFFATERGKMAVESMILRLPLVGEQIRAYRLATVARNLALMKDAGMPLSEALDVLAKGEPSPRTARALELSRRYLEFGNSPSSAFEGAQLMDPDAVRMVRAGEEADRLGVVFRRIASENDRQVARLSGRIAALIPPIMLVFAGIVVVALLSATLMPMLEMLGNI